MIDFSRIDSLNVKDRNARGQGPRTQRASVLKKIKKVLAQKIANFQAKKKGHDLGPFFTNQKIVLSLTDDRAFSRTCSLPGQS